MKNSTFCRNLILFLFALILSFPSLSEPSSDPRGTSLNASRAKQTRAVKGSRSPYGRLVQAITEATRSGAGGSPTPVALLPVLNYAQLSADSVATVQSSFVDAIRSTKALSPVDLNHGAKTDTKDVVLRTLAYRNIPFIAVPILERQGKKAELIVLLHTVSPLRFEAAFQEPLRLASGSELTTFRHRSHLVLHQPVFDIAFQNATLFILTQDAVVRYRVASNSRTLALIDEIELPEDNRADTPSRWPMGRMAVTPGGDIYLHATWLKRGCVVYSAGENPRIYSTLTGYPLSASAHSISYAEPTEGTTLLRRTLQSIPLTFHDLKFYSSPAMGGNVSLFSREDGHLGLLVEGEKEVIHTEKRYGSTFAYLNERVVVSSASEPHQGDHLIVLRADRPEQRFEEVLESEPFWGALTVMEQADLDGDGADELLLIENMGGEEFSLALLHVLDVRFPP